MKTYAFIFVLLAAIALMIAGCISPEKEGSKVEEQSGLHENVSTEEQGMHEQESEETSDEWMKNFGGKHEDYGNCVSKVDDGYIIIGFTNSYGKTPGEYYDAYMIKVDENGKEVWNKTYGAQFSDTIYSCSETDDGGYILTGSTNSYDPEWGSMDVYLVKLDSEGNQEWVGHYTYSDGSEDAGHAVVQADDGGYLVVGETNYYEKGLDIYVIKTDSEGRMEWQSVYGGTMNDQGSDVIKIDGGYIIAGSFTSQDKASDVYVMKIDEKGNVDWVKAYGGDEYDEAYSVTKAFGSGYVVTGRVDNSKVFAMKIDEQGNKVWEKTYNSKGFGLGKHIMKTSDGNYTIVGDYAEESVSDVYALKINQSGDKMWSDTFGMVSPDDDDYGEDAVESNDGKLVIVGTTERPTQDALLIKTAME